jgi:putative effector of murein hydrolase
MLGNVVIFMYIPSLDYFWSISTTFFFPYDRRINRNNDPPFVNKIVIAFKMLGNVVIFMYIPSLDYFWSISKIFFFLMTEE